MNAHPDTVAAAALGIHHERIAAAQQAELIRHAQRSQRTARPRQPLLTRIIALITARQPAHPSRPAATKRAAEVTEPTAHLSSSTT